MITRHDMFEPLLEALPDFRPKWEAFVEDWKDNPIHEKVDPRDLPSYIVIGDLAHYLVDLLEEGRVDDVARALAVCERWLVEGDGYVSTAALAGLLEDLENCAVRRGIAVDRVTPLLGPKGRDWWQKWTGTGAYATPAPQPVLALNLPADVVHRLDELARKSGRARGVYAREIKLEHLVDDKDE